MPAGSHVPPPSAPASGSAENADPRTRTSIFLQVPGNSIGIPLFDQREYILGRVEDGQSMIPDIDLNRFGARDKGVSRLHCNLFFGKNSLMVIDLGSANGTFVNGTPVPTDHALTVVPGDTLRLGELKLEVVQQTGGY